MTEPATIRNPPKQPLPWDGPVDDPVAALAGARAAHGDTFLDASGRYLFLFSPSDSCQ